MPKAKSKKTIEKPEDKDKALELALISLEKEFGKGVIIQGETNSFPEIGRIPSGAASLDQALSGGYARGRIIEVSGPEAAGKTSLALHAIAECQKLGGKCAFLDVEHALDVYYAEALGVDIANTIISQPDCAEDTLNIVDRLTRSNAIDLIVVDSVAALVSRKELEGEIGDSSVGLQARLMSQAMRMLVGPVQKTNTTIMFLNQIRMKIGVMYGCFHYDARVLLSDGTTEKIGKIVNQRLPVEVLSSDKNGNIRPRKVIDWHKNGKAKKFWQVVVDYPGKSGRSNIPVGDDHSFIVPWGKEKKLSELKIGDSVCIKDFCYLNDQEKSWATGMFLGDSSLKLSSGGAHAKLYTGHSVKQNKYCQFKQKLLNPRFVASCGYNQKGQYWFQSKPTLELAWMAEYKKGGALRYIDHNLVSWIFKESIALWYLDDGTFSGSYRLWGWGKSQIYATKLDLTSKNILADRMEDIGLPRPSLNKKGFCWSGKANKNFQKRIAQFVPRCMQYKIHPKFRNMCCKQNDFEAKDRLEKPSLSHAKIIDIYEKPFTKDQLYKFDITVEGDHCYFVDNVLVHNSPEVVSGGNALKFYASQRLDIRRIETLKNGDDKTGIRTRIKIIKNKVGPPFRQTELNIMFGEGIDWAADLLDMGVEAGLVEKSGAWFSYDGKQIGQGSAKAANTLREDEYIRSKLKEELFGPTPVTAPASVELENE